MRPIERKDICGYLPYGMKYQRINMQSIHEISITEDIDYGYQHSIQTAWDWMRHGQAKSILRPMSDLTKEVTHKGETFVPIVELAKIVLPGRDWRINNAGNYAVCGGIWDGYELSYTDGDFLLEERGHDEESYGGTKIWTVQIKNVVGIFDKLSEWMFDYRGLIPEGLAIDVNTLPQNPYEL